MVLTTGDHCDYLIKKFVLFIRFREKTNPFSVHFEQSNARRIYYRHDMPLQVVIKDMLYELIHETTA